MMTYRCFAGTLLFAGILFNGVDAVRGDNVPQPPSQTNNVQPSPSNASGLVDDSAPGWIWSGMAEYDDPSLQGGSGHAGGPGSYGAYTFHGTNVRIFGFATSALTVDGRVHKVGRAQISVDGKQIATVSMAKSDDTYSFNIATITGLSDGVHVLQVEPIGGWIVVDYIRITDTDNSADSNEQSAPTGAIPAAAQKSQPQAAIPGGNIADGVYRLAVKMNRSKYLSTHDAFAVDGSAAEIDSQSTDHQQEWQITSIGGSRYRLSPLNAPDEALTVLSTTLKNTGLAIGTWHDTGTPSSQWYIVPADTGYYRLVSATSANDVVDVLWSQDTDGNGLVLFKWHSSDNEEWALVPAKQ